MPFNISDFRQRFADGGARPTLFEVFVPAPSAIGSWNGESSDQMRFSAKTSSIPGMHVGVIRMPYFGREIKMAGDRTFEQWQCLVLNDEAFTVRKALEQWQNVMNKVSGDTNSIRDTGGLDDGGKYTSNIEIRQFDKTGGVTRTYTLVNAFPFHLDQIELGWEQKDRIEEYGVRWEYDYIKTDEI